VSSATMRPCLEHGDAVAQHLGFFQVVRGQDDGVARLVEAPDERPQASGATRHRRRPSARRARSPAADAPGPAPPGPAVSCRPRACACWHWPWMPGPGSQGFRRSMHRCRRCRNSRTGSAATPAPRRRGRRPVPGAPRRAAVLRHGSPPDVEPITRKRPASGRTSPARAEISVVLPAPLGPSRPKNSPGHFEIDSIQCLDTAKALGDLLNADRGGHSGTWRNAAVSAAAADRRRRIPRRDSAGSAGC
jgi:hypothetical protein